MPFGKVRPDGGKAWLPNSLTQGSWFQQSTQPLKDLPGLAGSISDEPSRWTLEEAPRSGENETYNPFDRHQSRVQLFSGTQICRPGSTVGVDHVFIDRRERWRSQPALFRDEGNDLAHRLYRVVICARPVGGDRPDLFVPHCARQPSELAGSEGLSQAARSQFDDGATVIAVEGNDQVRFENVCFSQQPCGMRAGRIGNAALRRELDGLVGHGHSGSCAGARTGNDDVYVCEAMIQDPLDEGRPANVAGANGEDSNHDNFQRVKPGRLEVAGPVVWRGVQPV